MGVVETANVANLPVGTRVFVIDGAFGVSRDGTWQDYVTVTQPLSLVRVPDELSDVEAAAVPEAYLTAQAALSEGGGATGRTLLIPAVGGSVGNAAIQLARAQGAVRVITSTASPDKMRRAHELGYLDVIDLSQQTLQAGVAQLTGSLGVDLVLDSVGGTLTGQAIESLKPGGTLVAIGFAGGIEFGQGNLPLTLVRSKGFTPLALAEGMGTDLVQYDLLGDGAGSLVDVWASRKPDGSLQILVWNGTLDQSKLQGNPLLNRRLEVRIEQLAESTYQCSLARVDALHSNISAHWQGGDAWPTPELWTKLHAADTLDEHQVPDIVPHDGTAHIDFDLAMPGIVRLRLTPA